MHPARRVAFVLHNLLAGAPAADRHLDRGLFFGQKAAEGAIFTHWPAWSAPTPRSSSRMRSPRPTTRPGVVSLVVGFGALIVGATGVVVELQDALNTVWKVVPKPNRGIWGFVRTRLVSIAMILSLGSCCWCRSSSARRSRPERVAA